VDVAVVRDTDLSLRQGRLTLLTVFVVGLVLRLAIAAMPERLLLRITIDDAYYYVRVAEEVGRGNGSTFDGINPTNGYHPLWMLVITPVTGISGPGTATVRVLIVLQSVIGAATFLVAARLLLRWLPPTAVALGLALWWLTPSSVLSSVSGVEASVACLLVVLLVVVAIRYVDAPRLPTAAAVGAVAGLAFLARTDTVFASIAVAVWVVVLVRRRSIREVGSHAGLASLSALILVLPWISWNLARFGTIEQASTWARPMVLWHKSTGNTAPRFSDAVTSAGSYVSGEWLQVLGWPPILAVGGVVAAGWGWRRFGFPKGRIRQLLVLGTLLVGSGTLLAAFHAGVRRLARPYYFEWVRMSLGLLVAALVAGLAMTVVRARASERQEKERRRVGLGACLLAGAVILLASAATVRRVSDPPFAWQTSMVEAGRWLQENTDDDERVLSFNAGLISYFSQRPVINLDGVINNESLAALENRQLARYMCSSGARWYVDFDPAVIAEYRPFLGDDRRRLQLYPVVTIRGRGASSYSGSELTVFHLSCHR
jgi:4-amino-4-deoxy-L-arabinose transferase-like glycosyltransferase